MQKAKSPPETSHNILLISGVPASGKSFFCKWLESITSFSHIEVEKDGVLEQFCLKILWEWCFTERGSAGPLVKELRTRGSPIVLEWGFPPYWLNVVEMLKREGVSIWWFDADQDAARRAFIKRRTVPVECFDEQMPKIVRAWASIRTLFEPNIITTLWPDDTRPSSEEIFRQMHGKIS